MASADLDLCYMTATEAIAKFKAKKLSPVELMKAVIARLEAVNPKINAITYDFFDRALKQAKDAEARYRKTDGRPRPLEGISCAIKDFHPVKGEITTLGSRIFENFRPDYTAPTVERLLKAGAIMHCRSTTPEFAHSGVTRSPLWGVTRNPWNLDYSSSGSSGGASALLAAGGTTLADGTDGGGSIRGPASACGLFGYKPPFGRNPLDRDHPLETILVYGPLTRSVADAALMQNVMSGHHSSDICSLRQNVRLPESFPDIKGWKVALSMNYGYLPVSPEVEKNTRAAAEVFRSLGCEVREVDLGWNASALDAWLTHWQGLFAALCHDYLPRWRYEMDPYVVKILEAGKQHDAMRLYRAGLVRAEMYKTLAPILRENQILICPTIPIPALKADHDNHAPEFFINGKPVLGYVGWNMTLHFNLVNQCPVMSVPSGFCPKTGVPTGIQIVSRTYDDLRVFRAASAFEGATKPWAKKRPKM